MIDTDETGQKKLLEITKAAEEFDWTDWEIDFLGTVQGKEYKILTMRQQATVSRLYDKLQK